MSQITTHVLDTSRGKPAQGIEAVLRSINSDQQGIEISRGITNQDGRITDLVKDVNLQEGVYELTFEVGEYFKRDAQDSFYPRVSIQFRIKSGEHYHVPLLLSPFGYSTYRGS